MISAIKSHHEAHEIIDDTILNVCLGLQEIDEISMDSTVNYSEDLIIL